MTVVVKEPEMIALPTLLSDGLKDVELFRQLISSNVSVDHQVRRNILNPNSHLTRSITDGVEYHPVIIPATYFADQNNSLCESNRWFIREDYVRETAKQAGLKAPPSELAHLAARHFSKADIGASNLRSIIVMTDTETQLMVGYNDPDRNFLMTVWKNFFQGVRHIHAWNCGFLFVRS